VVQVGRAAQQGRPQTKGCGCGTLFALIGLLSIGSAVVGVLAARDAADDDATVGGFESPATTLLSPIEHRDFQGPSVAAPTVSVGASTVHDLTDGAVAAHPLSCEQACTIAVSPIEGFDPVIRVVGPDGAVLAEDDDGGDDSLGSLVALPSTPVPGTELWVIDYSGDPGSYSVLVTPTIG
jgi:hypothetical protein